MTATRPLSALRLMFKSCAAACLLAVPLLGLAAHPWEEWADELGVDLNVSYDGVRVMTMAQGQFEATERKAPQKMFTEFSMGGMSGAFIIREDLDKAYMLMPTMGMYKEVSLSEALEGAGGGMEFSDIQRIGEETINGYPCVKYQARFKDNEGKGAGFIWVTDSGVPMKMDMIYSSRGEEGMRITSEFVELNLREQDPAVFELPEGLQPMGASGMLGSIFGGEGMNIPGLSGNSAPAAAPTGTAAAAAATSRSEPSSADLTTDNLTQSVQLHLEALGYEVGNTNGDLDTTTIISISQYQAEKGMPVTGEATPQVLGSLGADVDSR